MTEYHIEVSATAEKQIRSLRPKDQRRVIEVIKSLAEDPRPRGCRTLRGYNDVYRVRTGVFRVIYSVEDLRLLILILKIGHRKDPYR